MNDNDERSLAPTDAAGAMGFGAPKQSSGDLVVANREAQTDAETVKAQIAIARSFPRNQHQAASDALASCERPALAADAAYSFPRGGSRVTGPSVVLAREIARCWGNIRYGLRIVSVYRTAEGQERVRIRGTAHDLQTNAFVENEDDFANLIQRRQDGRVVWIKPDERDFRELVNRRGAILVRNAILQILPPDLVDECLATAEATNRKVAEKGLGSDRERYIRSLVRAFAGYGVKVEHLEAHLQHSLDAMTGDEARTLAATLNAFKDGQARPHEVFDLGPPPSSRPAPETGTLSAGAPPERPPAKKAEVSEASEAQDPPTAEPVSKESPIERRRRSYADRLAKFEVSAAAIDDYLGKPLDRASHVDLDNLRAAIDNIEGGMNPASYFPPA